MKNKIVKMSAIAVLSISLFNAGTNASLANSKEDSFEQLVQKLEETKNYIQSGIELSINERDQLSIENYNMLHDYLEENPNIDHEKKISIVDQVNDLDVIIYDSQLENNSISYTNSDDTVISPFALEIGGGTSRYKGDILISNVAKSYDVIRHGHTALMSTIPNYVVEAVRSGVTHNPASVYWGQAHINDEELYYVKDAPDSAYLAAYQFAVDQVGEPYNVKTGFDNNDEWYCSKLVYKAWQSAGYRVGPKMGPVLPIDIAASGNTIKYSNVPKNMF
ncbi:YiiX/YebB-like N1pC/P60 family cysteine hydrolase [Lysinibacillus sp. fkY74-1]|uniref:YiiX/YebB-like N1pC/P60 family cysteine hydrolase n=1 Tax=Lysinibacillus TaxID=400634 RepID=UPI0025A18635|nr:YiiX/YebB-like N1pC/P60 family cysteine hydrolase [Lysinibacillus sphaericus]MDM5351460.1 YiiX/YebB-like N1pC/P60 family cysteine hydrolase [Lysinibacillus sphaericus]MEB7451852.1 hypothetical protein [Lysinibacillus sphaericus]